MKVAIVTGGSRGIGLGISLRLAKDGYTVLIIYKSDAQTAETAVKAILEKNGNAAAFRADVSDSSQVNKVFESIIKTYKRIDLLVNNAGVAHYGLLTDVTDDDYESIFSVNVKGVVNCCRAALPHMISRKLGCIINISSIFGLTGASCEAVYSASKAAVIGLTKSLALETAPSNLTVNAIAAGAVDTRMLSNLSEIDKQNIISNTPLDRLTTADDIAGAVSFLAGNDAKFITGQVFNVSGGLVI